MGGGLRSLLRAEKKQHVFPHPGCREYKLRLSTEKHTFAFPHLEAKTESVAITPHPLSSPELDLDIFYCYLQTFCFSLPYYDLLKDKRKWYVICLCLPVYAHKCMLCPQLCSVNVWKGDGLVHTWLFKSCPFGSYQTRIQSLVNDLLFWITVVIY